MWWKLVTGMVKVWLVFCVIVDEWEMVVVVVTIMTSYSVEDAVVTDLFKWLL